MEFTGGVMNRVIAVFLNRSQSQLFSKILFKMQIPNQVVSTPRELETSCGLCVRFDEKYLQYAKSAFNQGNFSTFKNFYREVPLSNFKNNYIKI